MLHLTQGYVYAVDKTLPPVQGPLLPEQQDYIDALVNRWLLNSWRFSMRDSRFMNEADALLEANDMARRQAWVNSWGEPHFCPGYYDCMACYPD